MTRAARSNPPVLVHASETARTLERNLEALSRTNPQLVSRLRATPPRQDIRFDTAPDGTLVATLGTPPDSRSLCSRRRPLDEARLLVEQADVRKSAVFVVHGFALGHHVDALARKLQKTGLIIVFEPDLPLLRAVLEQRDITALLTSANIAMLHDPQDTGAIAAAVDGLEGIVAMGVTILDHPPSRARLATLSPLFSKALNDIIHTVKMNVTTTFVQNRATVRNLLLNIEHYASRPGIEHLKDAWAGRPAIVISAGPSLRKNMHLLRDPAVRDNFLLVCVQTTLRPLLRAGVRPHFVTALDHAEISRRFYEGLSREDMRDTTLVIEPKVNPAVPDACPGDILCVGDRILDDILGISPNRDTLTPGATVAHLAYYLARYCGADPVALVGQDLAFTDHYYYGPGAAIHDVWASELNTFNTLESMEWERIARTGKQLRTTTDHAGNTLYTDEQMASYRVQFERDFAADTQRGLHVYDCTEGGSGKAGAEPRTLRWFLDTHDAQTPRTRTAADPADAHRFSKRKLRDRLSRVHREVYQIERHSERAGELLEQMRDHHDDQPRVNQLIREVETITKAVLSLEPTLGVVQYLNQTGQFNRLRSDRDIKLDEDSTPLERQKRQIQRDLTNVRSIREAAESLRKYIDDARHALDGAPKRTASQSRQPGLAAQSKRTRKIIAVVLADFERSGLGTPGVLAEPFLGSATLAHTVERTRLSRKLDRIVIVTQDPERARALLEAADLHARTPIDIEHCEHASLRRDPEPTARARAAAPACWRGSVAGRTVFDELASPEIVTRVVRAHDADAALLLAGDWALIDPRMIDAIVDRHLENPDEFRLVFTQAPPGLAPCLLGRVLVEQMAKGVEDRVPTRNLGYPSLLASVGGALAYLPVSPASDLIGLSLNTPIDPRVRDCPMRCIPDTPANRRELERALEPHAQHIRELAGTEIVRAIQSSWDTAPPLAPTRVGLELSTTRVVHTHPRTDAPARGFRPAMTADHARALVDAVASLNTHALLTIGAGQGDPLTHPEPALRALEHARATGIANTHLWTDLLCERDTLEVLIDLCKAGALSVLSVDLLADSPSVYEQITGVDLFFRAQANIQEVLAACGDRVWVVPRITRTDHTVNEIEPFYTKWTCVAGWAVIDPPGVGGLREPAAVRRRRDMTELVIRSDGACVDPDGRDGAVLNADDLASAWNTITTMRAASQHTQENTA